MNTYSDWRDKASWLTIRNQAFIDGEFALLIMNEVGPECVNQWYFRLTIAQQTWCANVTYLQHYRTEKRSRKNLQLVTYLVRCSIQVREC